MAVDVQTFTPGSGLWTKPANALWTEMFAIGGGGCGGAGAQGGAGTNRHGGGGGGGGAWSRALYAAADLPATLSVQCGAGGGGAGYGPQERSHPDQAFPSTDSAAATIGHRLSITADGIVTHLRYWRGSNAARKLSLWSAAGVKLGTVTDAATASNGWRELQLPTPVVVTAGTYTISYTTESSPYYYSSGMPGSTAPHITGATYYYTLGATEAFPATQNAGYTASLDLVYQQSVTAGAAATDSYVGANQDSAWVYASAGGNGGNGSTAAGAAGAAGANGEFPGPAGAAGGVVTPTYPASGSARWRRRRRRRRCPLEQRVGRGRAGRQPARVGLGAWLGGGRRSRQPLGAGHGRGLLRHDGRRLRRGRRGRQQRHQRGRRRRRGCHARRRRRGRRRHDRGGARGQRRAGRVRRAGPRRHRDLVE